MRAYSLFFAVAFLFVLSSCSSNTEPGNTKHAGLRTISIDSFINTFPKISLPFGLPAETGNTSSQINAEAISGVFANSGYKPAFGDQKDVPDLADNAGSARFYAEGMFQTDGYTAVIIRKAEDEDTYYYLSTFKPGGEFIQGMCIAFIIGNGDAERIAAVNDDFSVQIRQTDKLAENPATSTQNIFYEITPDGQIQLLKTDDVKTPV